MINYDDNSYLDGPAHCLEDYRLMDSTSIQSRSCCSLKGAKHSICSRLKAWRRESAWISRPAIPGRKLNRISRYSRQPSCETGQ